MKCILLNILVSFYFLFNVSESAKILTWIPTASISHQVPFRPLLHELARRGHQVTVITTDPAFPKGQAPENLKEIDLHDLSYDIWREKVLKHVKGSGDQLSIIKFIMAINVDIMDQQLQTKEVQNIINGNEEYDLIILEAWVIGTLALTHRFKAPVIQMSSLGAMPITFRMIGAPTHPILYPQLTSHRIYNLTLVEKMDEIYSYYQVNKMNEECLTDQINVMRKHFGEDLPPVDELLNRVDMLFLNIHPIFEGNQPVPQSVQYVWGIHKKPEKDLPQDLKQYLDSSKNGVIYMSFGTNMDPANLPPDTIQMFIRVFSQLPYNVLWKWSQDELPGKSDNIRIGKWFPQSDLLRHPNVRLFITQGGLQSTDEAINAGVPLVGIPMLGDQWYNVEKYVHFGIGVKLDVESLAENNFRNAVETVLGNESYRKNIEKLRDLMQDELQPPLQRAVWWVEYVLRHGGARHLRAPAANISWAQYYEVELVSYVLLGLFIVSLIVTYSLYISYTFVTKKILLKVKLKGN